MQTIKLILSVLIMIQLVACESESGGEFAGQTALTGGSNALNQEGKYTEQELIDILEIISKDGYPDISIEDIFEGGLTDLEIENLLEIIAQNPDLSPEEKQLLKDSLLEIAKGDGKGKGPISVIFEEDKIIVTSPKKDLSNVVIEFTDGTRERFEGLSGHRSQFSGTGKNTGKIIVRAWIKAGSNASGDGPGYGERFES